VTIAEVLFYFPNALAIVSSARYAAATRADARALLRRSARWCWPSAGPLRSASRVVARPIIRLGFGPSYAESATVLLIILPGVVATRRSRS
jgi:O-antigen/teichoic acid export membrane protein